MICVDVAMHIIRDKANIRVRSMDSCDVVLTVEKEIGDNGVTIFMDQEHAAEIVRQWSEQLSRLAAARDSLKPAEVAA